MKLSARNQIPGQVTDINLGASTGNVKVDIGGGHQLASTITVEAIKELGLEKGSEVVVVIKASDVMLAAS